MDDFYLLLCARLEPFIKDRSNPITGIDLWNNQLQAITEKKQKAIRFDQIFVEFIVNQVNDVGSGVKDKFLTVRFYFGIKQLRSKKFRQLDFAECFSQYVQGFASEPNTFPVFSGMHETALENDEDHDAVALPFVDYDTVLRDVSGYFFGRYREATIATIGEINIDTNISNP